MRYKIFGHSGLRVSEYVLGAGTFGTSWGYGSEPNEARRIFDLYPEKGGNFLDTADFYQFGKSEELVGDFVASSREDFVLATKFSLGPSANGSLIDRELLPMATALGLGTVAWSPLGGGLLTGKYRKGEQGRATSFKRLTHSEDTQQKRAILDTLDAVAKETGATAGQVAIAWISAHGIIPILGARTKEQLEDNLAASDVHLSPDQILRLEEVSAVPLGFPHDVVAREPFRSRLLGGKLGELELPVTPVA